MAIYVVTGKLGGGKTLGALSKINDAVQQGRRIATNLDIVPVNLPCTSRTSKNVRIVRVPDRPGVDDIQALGFGIEGVNSLTEARRAYDESKFGLLVLDECGTWLNSRDWQAEGRRELINFLLHIRKHLWDVYLIIQDISLLDKQARKALAEHVVYCRRMDRMSIPILSFFWGLVSGSRVPLPRFHLAHVKYGDQPTSMTVDKWWYRGDTLYEAYDTTQVFTEDYPYGLHSLLPPWHCYSRTLTTWNLANVMRLTKIYLRQYSKTLLLAAGIFAGATFARFNAPEPIQTAIAAEPSAGEYLSPSSLPVLPAPGRDDPEVTLLDRLRLTEIADYGQGVEVWFTDGDRAYNQTDLQAFGLSVSALGKRAYRVADQDNFRVIRWF